jgi:hypothetical protein
MQHQVNRQLAESLVSWPVDEAIAKAKRLGGRIAEVLAICADAWAAANTYEELSRLSDAELERRGIPRGELHRCVSPPLGRPGGHPCGW